MNLRGPPLIAFAALTLAVIALYANAQRHRIPPAIEFQGWIEGQYIYVSPDEAGRIETMSVREGDEIKTGSPLFTLDSELQRAALAEAEAALINAKITYERAHELLRKSVGSQKSNDDAEAALRTAEARLNSARTKLERRRILSPVLGAVQEVYFRVGEMVVAGRPIVSVLPPGSTRLRFFVPQAILPRISLGNPVAFRCDGCDSDLRAHINFISTQAEFTPPIIYSQEERARLVFRVEALPDRPEALRVGQPVTVMLLGNGGAPYAQR